MQANPAVRRTGRRPLYSSAGQPPAADLRRYEGYMRLSMALLISALAAPVFAGTVALPPEVQSFVSDRDTCDHFRGEPVEGTSPEQIRRREFVAESLEIFCAGTDRRLAALKKRYKNNSEVIRRLSHYEENIEGPR